MSAESWVLLSVGVLIVIGGIAIARFRVPLARWQQGQHERIAIFKSGPLGPGRTTPRTMTIIAIGFVVVGSGWILGALSSILSN